MYVVRHLGECRLDNSRFGFLDTARIIACIAVVYAHLVGYRAPYDDPTGVFLRSYLEQPLGVIWHFGYFGVALFFLISGFVITHVAQRETLAAFSIRRLFRIVPPMVVSVLIAGWLACLTGICPTPMDLLSSVSLFWSDFRLNTPTYTLVIELMFYGIIACALPVVKLRPALAVAIVALAPIAVSLVWSRLDLPPDTPGSRVRGYVGLLPLFAVGVVLYYWTAGRLAAIMAALLMAMAWAAFVWSAYATSDSPDAQGFTSDAVLSVAVFVLAIVLHKGSSLPSVRYLAGLTYSVYLLHVPVGGFVIERSGLPYWPALALALVATLVGSILLFTTIDRPFQALARRLTDYSTR